MTKLQAKKSLIKIIEEYPNIIQDIVDEIRRDYDKKTKQKNRA